MSDEFVSSFYHHLIRLGIVAVQIVWHKMIQYPKNINTCLTKNGGLLILLVQKLVDQHISIFLCNPVIIALY